MTSERFSLDDYDYELPEELIAQSPATNRLGSRLLLTAPEPGSIRHALFPALAAELKPGDLLVLNTTRVIPARLFGRRDKTGGKAELLLVAPTEDGWDILLKTRGKPETEETLTFGDGRLTATLKEKGTRGRWRAILSCPAGQDPLSVVDAVGTMPLPPYIKRSPGESAQAPMDRERYQTVFADTPGAVAAPTAGLHFTEAFLDELRMQGVKTATVTLHVGLGTFQPIEAEDFRDHDMHAEIFEVSDACAEAVNRTRKEGGRVIAVGTTSLRSLESAWSAEDGEIRPASGATRLFIYPPHAVRSADCLLTNFHLPRSSLMLLVSAFAGREVIMDAYREAVAERYRFFSYGDAMLLFNKSR